MDTFKITMIIKIDNGNSKATKVIKKSILKRIIERMFNEATVESINVELQD